MSDATINIEIINGGEETGTPAEPTTPEITADAPKEKSKDIKKIAGVGFAMNMAKQGAQLGISNVGFITGSSYTQDKINAGVKLAGYGVMLAVNPYIALGAIAMDTITSVIQHNQKQWEEEKRIGRILGRSGSEYNRSRS